MSVTRLARLLRQQDEGALSPTLGAALATIGRHGPMSLGDLAVHEHVAPPTVTKVVGKLHALGFIERTADEGDRRVCLVRLSPSGRRQLEANRRRRKAWLAARLGELDDSERAQLANAVEILEALTGQNDHEIAGLVPAQRQQVTQFRRGQAAISDHVAGTAR